MSKHRSFKGINWQELEETIGSDMRISISAGASDYAVVYSGWSSVTPISTETIEFYDRTAIAADMGELLAIAHRTENKVDEIMNMVREIRNSEESENDENEDVASIPDEEVRALIADFIADLDVFYPSDIAYELNLDYEQVCRILELLKNEGALGDIE